MNEIINDFIEKCWKEISELELLKGQIEDPKVQDTLQDLLDSYLICIGNLGGKENISIKEIDRPTTEPEKVEAEPEIIKINVDGQIEIPTPDQNPMTTLDSKEISDFDFEDEDDQIVTTKSTDFEFLVDFDEPDITEDEDTFVEARRMLQNKALK